VPGFEGVYEASATGCVRSLTRTVVGRDGIAKVMRGCVLRAHTNTGGYLCLRLGRGAPLMVHQIVALTFLGPRPAGAYVCHEDGNRQNNRASNLRYDTPKANQRDRVKHGTHTKGSACPQAKLKEAQVRTIKCLLGKESHAALAARFSVSKSAVTLIAMGRNWKHVQKE
jgi:hypothetical protein